MSLASMAFYRGLDSDGIAARSGLPRELVLGVLDGDVALSALSPSEQAAFAGALGMTRPRLVEAERERARARLPEALRIHFWDTRFDALDRKGNQDQIITRLLDRAGIDGLRWIIYAYTPSEIRETARRTRRLSPASANFLRERLGLSRDEMAYYRVRLLDNWR